MTFINSAFLGFLALGMIPLIIYLINRQRYRRVEWAAMEFLLRAMQKNRRRLRLENLLLLIIRTAIILLLVLAFARPLFDRGALPVLGAKHRAEILLLDCSYSMGAREASRTVLESALTRARLRAKSLTKGDRLGIVLAGGFPDTIYKEPLTMTDGELPRVLADLDAVELRYEPTLVATTLQSVAQWVGSAGDNSSWVVHFYTDLQRQDWVNEDGGGDPAIVDALERLDELGVELRLHPLGASSPRNATVSSLSCEDSLLCVDLPTSFQVLIENHSRESLAALEVELWIDEELRGSRQVSLDPGEDRVVSFPHVFRSVGLARVQAVLKSDDLLEDNVYHSVFGVRESVDVLVVDGGRSSDGSEETAWLVPAIGADLTTESSSERLTPFRCEVIHPDSLPSASLMDYDAVILADVSGFTSSDSGIIEEFLRDGGGVLVFLGDRVEARSYREEAHRQGDGWFPFAPGQKVLLDPRDESYRLEVKDGKHPTVSYLADNEEAGLGLVRVNGYWTVDGEVPETGTILAFDDFQATPALIEKGFGDGTTMVLNTGPDREWSNFPITPAYVCFLQETLPYLAGRSDTPRNLGIGEPYSRIISGEEYARTVYVYNPDGSGARLELPVREDGKTFDLSVPGQGAPGSFEIRFGGQPGSEDEDARKDFFAVNADPREGKLTPAVPEEILEVYPTGALTILDSDRAEDAERDSRASSGEVWRSLMWIVLALLVMECGVARWFGRAR